MSSLALPLSASPQAVATFKLGYRPWLDGLRGLAILSVMAYHCAPQFLAHGHVGVDLFFVISGFLITVLLLEERNLTAQISFRNFYLRRVLRLFPALAAMLIVALLVMYLAPSVGQQYRSVLYAAFYVMNWFMAFNPNAVSSTLYITWSLSIEEQFYLLWPLLLSLASRFRVRPIAVLTCLVLSLALVCLHKANLISQGASVIRIAHGSDTRIDGLIIGCCVGVVAASGFLPRLAQWIFVAIPPLFAVFVAYTFGMVAPYGFGLTLVNLFFAAVLILLLAAPPSSLAAILNARPLRWIGKVSYSLYLWHLFAAFASERMFTDAGLRFLFFIALAFGMASASYYLIERPFLKLKQRVAR